MNIVDIPILKNDDICTFSETIYVFQIRIESHH